MPANKVSINASAFVQTCALERAAAIKLQNANQHPPPLWVKFDREAPSVGRQLTPFGCQLRKQWAEAVWKLKKSKRDENDILGFDLKIEWACGVSAESGL